MKMKTTFLVIIVIVNVLISFSQSSERTLNFPKIAETPVTIPPVSKVWVFLMAGQSNMAGRGFVEPQDTLPNPRVLSINALGKIEVAKEPLHTYEPTMAGLDCGAAFANTLLNFIPDSVTVLMVPTAVGGSAIDQWLGDSLHRNVKLLSNFREKLRIGQSFGVVKGILWHQGESDAKPGLIENYEEKIRVLFNLFRDYAGVSNLPVIVGEIGLFSDDVSNKSKINQAIHRVADSDPLIGCIPSGDLNHKGDKLHFDSQSQRTMGQRMALEYLKLTRYTAFPSGYNKMKFPQKLPPYIAVLDSNAWKPNWDKHKSLLYYIEKSTGEVISMDMVYRKKTKITAGFAHKPFSYCLSLVNEDLLLCGNTSEPTGDSDVDDHRQEMWVLKKNAKIPVSLNEYCDRSPAVSFGNRDIAWTLPGQSDICTGRIVYRKGIPKIEKRCKILSFKDSSHILLGETQDFHPRNKHELLITGFTGSETEPFNYADIFGYNLKTHALVNYSGSPGTFDEARGVAPDGKSIYIESDRHFDFRMWKTDIYKLLLDRTGEVERITWFSSDFPDTVVENPVMSRDGKFLAFQVKYGSIYYIFMLDMELYQTLKYTEK